MILRHDTPNDTGNYTFLVVMTAQGWKHFNFTFKYLLTQTENNK